MFNSYVFTSTLRDMLRPARIVPWVLLALVLGGVSFLWTSLSRDPLGALQYGMLVRFIVYRVVALACAMFTVMVIGQEVEQKTIVYLVTRPIERGTLIVSRSLAAVAAATLMSWMSVIAVGFAILGPGVFGQTMFWMDVLIMLLGALAYTALFVSISLLINRAMLVILLFTFVWEAFVPLINGDMYLLTINTYMSALALHPNKTLSFRVASQLSGDISVSPWVAWIVLGAVCVSLLWFCSWWFSRHSYLPREDAE